MGHSFLIVSEGVEFSALLSVNSQAIYPMKNNVSSET